jgi:hypothetical protein
MKRFLSQGVLVVTIVIATSLIQPLSYISALAQPGGCKTFSETGKSVCGRFLEYWQKNGGLAQQGLPLSGEFTEVSDLNGKSYTVQYFERAVFEKHPENVAPHDVLLSQLGTFQFKRKYPDGQPSGGQPPPTQAPPPPGGTALVVRGNGTNLSGPVVLKKGLAVVTSSLTVAKGTTGIFGVELVDGAGIKISGVVYDYGDNFNIVGPEEVPADGTYFFKVESKGDWTISVTQPRSTYSAPPATQTFSGRGSAVTQLFSLKAGGARFQLTHTNGTKEFSVSLVDGNGSYAASLADKTGPASVSTIENIEENGVFLLWVDADGDWTITIQQ